MFNYSAIKLPAYSKISQVLLGGLAFFFIMYIGQNLVIPIVYAAIISILLNPVVNYLTRRLKIHRVLAILAAIIGVLIALIALLYFIGSQASMFSETLPLLKERVIVVLQDIFAWVSHTFNLSNEKGDEWIAKMKTEGMNSGTSAIGQTLLTLSGILVWMLLLPVYTFMMLFYKPHLREFINRMFQRGRHAVVAEVIAEIKVLVQSYLVGLLFEAGLVAILNSVALLIIGVQYAILVGIIGALLNVIPYIGGLVAIAIPMIIAFATQSPETALWVLLAYLLVQFIDNNLIVPRIVASKVKINGLFSIIVVLVGGALWGASGMFLAIPLTAIVKVIFDRIEPLKPIGFLLGDTTSGILIVPLILDLPIIKKKKKAMSHQGCD